MTDGSSLPWYREQAVQAGFAAKNAILEAQQVAESPRLAISREWWAKTDARRAATFARLADFLDHLGCASLEDVEAELMAFRSARQRVRDSFGHGRYVDGKCQCVYCTSDVEGLTEHAADYEMKWHWEATKREKAEAEVSVLRSALKIALKTLEPFAEWTIKNAQGDPDWAEVVAAYRENIEALRAVGSTEGS